MKIISKQKDFYDYQGYGYDTSDDIVFVRNMEILSDKELKKIISKHLNLSKTKISYTTYKTYSKNIKYEVYTEFLYVGIYPYVYVVPFINITDVTSSIFDKNSKLIPLKWEYRNDYDYIMDIFYKYYPDTKKSEVRCDISSKSSSNISFYYNSKYLIDENVKRIPELFEELKTPTFIFKESTYKYTRSDITWWNSLYYSLCKVLHVCPSNDFIFVKDAVFDSILMNILGPIRDIINSRPIYNDIENYLWGVKEEPISEPDNKTKIINHGFDVKTSFRKM